MQFVDECKISVKAGNGGAGIVSWRREAHVGEGGPWGGDGGKGGDVVAIGDHNINTLFDLRNKKSILAQEGGKGGTQMASGKTGVSAIIRLPLGTSIYNSDTGELIADILEDGQVHVICYGGKGGHGNAFFKSSFNRIPSLHENGDIGESMNIELKLKYVADVGLVGLPNAGKSTLISQISNAKPRIANYQFTTLTPVLGTVNIGKDNLVFEDIPGLINGASEGKGLGHEFLKHIERCYVLIHLISLDPQDNADAYEAYETITNELKQYSAAVGNKPVFIVANKIDTEGSDENLKLLEKKLGKKVLAISGKEKTNVDKLLQTVYKEYSKIIEEIKKYESENKKEPIPEQKEKKFFKDVRIIPMEEGIWKVESIYLAYWYNRIPLDTNDNNIRFSQKILSAEVEAKAKKLGAKAGDTLIICGTQFIID